MNPKTLRHPNAGFRDGHRDLWNIAWEHPALRSACCAKPTELHPCILQFQGFIAYTPTGFEPGDRVRPPAPPRRRHRLERGLVASGDRVIRVSPGLTETSRRAVRESGKSDPIDARAIARAALREGIDTLPVAFLDEQALKIRILNDYRNQLITERVRLGNRLRSHLVQIPRARGAAATRRPQRPADRCQGRSQALPTPAQPASPRRQCDPLAGSTRREQPRQPAAAIARCRSLDRSNLGSSGSPSGTPAATWLVRARLLLTDCGAGTDS